MAGEPFASRGESISPQSLCYTFRPPFFQNFQHCEQVFAMDAQKLAHFRSRLLSELQAHTDHVRDDQAAALELTNDDVKDTVDMSQLDVNKEMAFTLGDRESQMLADIDQALLRIEEGSYGTCARCGKPIDERRLEALPTARYDAACQALIESANGENAHASL
jgi:DnaK suppressor protein